MIVCLCRGLSDHAIRARLGIEGVGGARRLVEACGAGTDCGSCAWLIEALLEAPAYTGSTTPSLHASGAPTCAAMSGSSSS